MSLRNMFQGSIVKPGFNPLVAQTTTTYYNLFTWGLNDYGQLGVSNTTNYSSPKQVGSNTTSWASLSGGGAFSAAIKTDGTLWTWGRNNTGQLGLGNITNYSSPKQVGVLTTWSTVALGQFMSYAVKTDGTLWSWGANSFGQLGLGTTTYYSSPKQVGALTNWSSNVAGGRFHVVAIKTDGTMWSWGRGSTYGALGLGNLTDYSSPKQIGALTTWSKVASTWWSVAAIKTDGTLWTWGKNGSGELGSGTTTNRSSPVQVGALTNWLLIAGAGYAFYAVKTNGTLWAWGDNSVGTLGLNNVTSYSSPKQVGALTNWSKVQTGIAYLTCRAIKTDGTLWAWGYNASGQVGDGTATQQSSPVQIGSLTSWLAVAGGYYHSVAAG